MTPKQEERIRNKIAKIKKALAADKRYWGGQYHDGHGYRYLPPQYYLKLQDYKGGSTYFRWFEKTFPDDSGFPIFLFEWTVTLFKNNKLIEAERKTLETYMSNIHILDKFLGKPFVELDISIHSNWELESLAENMTYSNLNTEYADFSKWLENYILSEKFNKIANEFIEIKQKMKNEPRGITRNKLFERERKLLEKL